MQIVYIMLCILILWEIMHRKIDFISVAAISFILYTNNCIVGEVWIIQSDYFAYHANINFKTYFLICTQLLIIYIYIYLKRKKIVFIFGKRDIVEKKIYKREKNIGNNNDDIYFMIILFISITSFFYEIIFKIGISNFFSELSKSAVIERTSSIFGLSIWGALVCFFYYYSLRKKIYVIISASVLIMYLLLGSRAYIASAFVGLIIIKSFEWEKKLGKKSKKRVIFLTIIMFVFLIFYKVIYREIRAGDFSTAVTLLKDSITWNFLFDISEFRNILANYNYIIENNISFPIADTLARIISIIPFINDNFSTEYPLRLSVMLKEEINTSYGLGSTFWGECYAMGGIIFLLLMTFFWITFINYLNNKVKIRKSPYTIVMAAYLSFYIHRLDWLQVMGCLKIVMLLYIFNIAFNIIGNKYHVKNNLSRRETY